MQKVSIISPTINNLQYLKLSYDSIRKHCGLDHEYCVADDGSTDGTIEWCKEIAEHDNNFKFITNDTGKKLGHVILYDKLIHEVAANDIIFIWHADMIAGPNLIGKLLLHVKDKTVVCANRIEPPLHSGFKLHDKTRIIKDFGIYPSEFDNELFEKYCIFEQNSNNNCIKQAIFAPWLMYKKDFTSINGHDPIFAPYPHEDIDIFRRFILAGYNLIQADDALLYHFTCRGHRWTEEVQKDNSTYEFFQQRAYRNYIRKWGCGPTHDIETTLPKELPKYDVGLVLHNAQKCHIIDMEPLCSTIYTDCSDADEYIRDEQPKTFYDISKRVLPLSATKTNDVIIEFDIKYCTQQDFEFIFNIQEILKENSDAENAQLKFSIFDIYIKKLIDRKNENLINVRSYKDWRYK